MALLSCFVWQERQEKRTRLKDKLQGPFAELQTAARRVAKVKSAPELNILIATQEGQHSVPWHARGILVCIGGAFLGMR